MNKKEFKELDREQMIIAFNQLKDDYSVLFDKLEQEKEKNKELEEKLKIAKQLYNDACICMATDCVEKDKIREIVNECLEKKKDVITDKEEYCFNVNDNSFLAHRIVELLEEV